MLFLLHYCYKEKDQRKYKMSDRQSNVVRVKRYFWVHNVQSFKKQDKYYSVIIQILY